MQQCNFWDSADSKWQLANWTWDECQLVQNLVECLKWGEAGMFWSITDNQWNTTCSVAPPTSSAAPTASYAGVDATTLIQPWLEEPWNPYRAGETKKKRLVKLICKVKGQNFSEERYVKDAKITVEDIRMVVKKVANIDLDIRINNANVHSIHGPE